VLSSLEEQVDTGLGDYCVLTEASPVKTREEHMKMMVEVVEIYLNKTRKVGSDGQTPSPITIRAFLNTVTW
jgi:hypothetical protein